MPTYAELAAEMLKDAAAFFTNQAAGNEPLHLQMRENAVIFEALAQRLTDNPMGQTGDGQTYHVLAAKTLRDAAQFFRKIGDKNIPLQEQMNQNAAIFDQIATGVAEAPFDIFE